MLHWSDDYMYYDMYRHVIIDEHGDVVLNL